jgi:hypothetical protein
VPVSADADGARALPPGETPHLVRRVQHGATVAVLLAVIAALGYGGLSGITGADPLDVGKDEVADTPDLPGYQFVHHRSLAGIVQVTKAVEPDGGWDAQWELDGVTVRSRIVADGGLELYVEEDLQSPTETDVSNAIQNLLATSGFRTAD